VCCLAGSVRHLDVPAHGDAIFCRMLWKIRLPRRVPGPDRYGRGKNRYLDICGRYLEKHVPENFLVI
jgi:hypothetical protein